MKPWLPSDEQSLRTLYPTLPLRDLMQKFGRSAFSIKSKADKMGLHRDFKRWSEEHLAAIRRFYTSRGTLYVAALVGRRARAVQYMALELGLRPARPAHRPKDWTDEQIATLRRVYPVSGPQAAADLIGRKLQTVYCMASKLHLQAPPRKRKEVPARSSPPEDQSWRLRKVPLTEAELKAEKKAYDAQRSVKRAHAAPTKRQTVGPAYLPGPPIITQNTRHIVGPSPRQSYHTNTHSAF